MDELADAESLLAQARAAREGRDRWRSIGPVLRRLREEMDIPWRTIRARTGISRATGSRLIAMSRRTSST